jgi:serine/threonine-protein kinase
LAYRAAKFVRRNRLAVGAASATLLALLAGVVGTTWQAIEAHRQRAEAIAQRDRAQALLGRNEAIVDFVDLMFSEGVPAGQSAAVQQMLERSERLVTTAFAGRPDHQGEVLRVLSSYYSMLNLANKQSELLARAREIVEQVPDRSLKASLACSHASALSALNQDDEARRLLATWIEAPDIEAAVAASCLQVRAEMAQRDNDAQATLRYAEAGLARLRAGGASVPMLEANLLGDLGFGQRLAGRNAEADRTFQAALDRMRKLGRGESHEAGWIMIGHGLTRYSMADFKGGLDIFERVLRIYETRGDAVISPSIIGNQAYGLELLGRHDEALAAYDRALEASRRSGLVTGEAFALVGRASVQADEGRMGEAQATLDGAAATLARLPAAHASRVRAAGVQGRIDAARGDLSGAAARYTGVIELMSRQGAASPPLATAYRRRAEVSLQRGDVTQALADARKALEVSRSLQADNPHSAWTGQAALTLGQVLLRTGDRAGAREALALAQAQLEPTLGAEHRDTRAARELLAAP